MTYSWYIFASGSLVIVNIDSFELEIRSSLVGASWVNSMFITDNFPELGSDLVAALSGLDVDDFSHCGFGWLAVGC